RKEYVFGDVTNGKMHMNEYGVVAHHEWFKTELIRDNIRLDEFVVMPNHVHGIIEIIDKTPIVGANHDSPLHGIGPNKSLFKSSAIKHVNISIKHLE
ncbi:MAG: transposase, partial [Algiphilus sp.]